MAKVYEALWRAEQDRKRRRAEQGEASVEVRDPQPLEPTPEPEFESEPDPELETEPERASELEPEFDPESQFATEPEPVFEPQTGSQAEPEPFTDRMPERFTDRMPAHLLERMPEGVRDRMPEHLSDRMPERVSERTSGRFAEGMPETDRMSDRVSDRMPKSFAGRAARRLRDRMPERVRDRLPGRLLRDRFRGDEAGSDRLARRGKPKKPGFWSRFWPGRSRRSRNRKQERSQITHKNAANKRRITMLQPDSYIAEQYRGLRGRIDAIAAQRPVCSIMVTSALPGDGKTTASINLAIVTAMGVGCRVLLVDCDMRKPKVHTSLGLHPDAGLAEVLSDTTSLDQAIVKVEGINLEVLPVRALPPNPSELLSSVRMRELIDELAQRYDRVILDTPAALGLPDAKAVSALSDGIVMVVRADVTPQVEVRTAIEILDQRRMLGLVLNGAHVNQGRYGYAR